MPLASVNGIDICFELHCGRRGLGQTSKSGGEYTMADYADDAAALIHSMGWASCHVLGTSFGGMVALNLAVRHPDVVEQSNASLDPVKLAELGRQFRARAHHDVVADLPDVACPTLVCAGRYDGIAPVTNSELLVDRMPAATLHVFDGGHVFLVQDRTAFRTIIEFLEEES